MYQNHTKNCQFGFFCISPYAHFLMLNTQDKARVFLPFCTMFTLSLSFNDWNSDPKYQIVLKVAINHFLHFDTDFILMHTPQWELYNEMTGKNLLSKFIRLIELFWKIWGLKRIDNSSPTLAPPGAEDCVFCIQTLAGRIRGVRRLLGSLPILNNTHLQKIKKKL